VFVLGFLPQEAGLARDTHPLEELAMNRFPVAALLVLAVLPLARAAAQEATPEAERRRPPTILVRPDPEKPSVPLRVVSANVQVMIVDGFATTTIDLTFANDLGRVLEGELVLPLPAGATISSFALEIDGKLRPASVVEREKARVVFEAVERQRVDPGLVEWVAGNTFRTRVYPIPAKGTKRVVLGYEQELRESAFGHASYTLPLSFGSKLDKFSCDVSARSQAAPTVRKGGLELAFENDKPGLYWAQTAESGKDLLLDLVVPAKTAEVAVARARVRSPLGREGELVFTARVPAPAVNLDFKRVPVSRLTLLYDASGSAAGRDRAKEAAFLEAYLKLMGKGSVRLVLFSNDVWGEESFTVDAGSCAPLLARIAAVRPDGGTRFSCLDLAKWDATTDLYLLMSDGLSNFGAGDLKLGAKPISCVTSAASFDPDALERIAARGAVVDLRELGASEAVARIDDVRQLLVSVTGAEDVYPSLPMRVDGRIVTIAGRIHAGDKPIKLTLAFKVEGAVNPPEEVTVEIDPRVLVDSGIVERVWAAKKIEALSRNKAANEDEIVKTAKAHGIVTPFTSLLVLDTLEQYVRYHVVPPKDMEEAYWKVVESEKATAAKSREERIAEVRTKWQARVAWWKQDFVYPEGLKVKDEAAKEGAGEGWHAHDDEGHLELAPAPSAAPSGSRHAERLRGAADAASAGKAIEPADEGGPHITLKPWDPSTPYLAAYKAADAAKLYETYLTEKASYPTSTAFYLDSADYFYAQKQPELALRILSNLAELNLESAPLLRILGYRLKQAGSLDLAIATFQYVAKIRPEEPQSFRDLALAQADAKDWPSAVANLEKVVLGKWDDRFPDIDLIALGELNEVLRLAHDAGVPKLQTLPDDLIQPLDWDIRVILTWDADACDMDLWVTEPSGEKAFYGHQQTTTGGQFGKDFTRGYGPEEYLVKKAMKGPFKIQVNYYGNTQQILAGDTTIQVTVIRNYGRPNEERQEVTRRLKDNKEVLDIADIVFGGR
jgi:tetratricopeptide (TPR) repeat protein